jgi:GTP-binding protein
MNAFAVSSIPQQKLSDGTQGAPPAMVIMDMPGYGHASHAEWGEQIMRYLSKRPGLRRAFVLVDSTHGLKETDRQMLGFLNAEGINHQVILSKVDRLLWTRSRSRPNKEVMAARLDGLRMVMHDIGKEVWGRNKQSMFAADEILCCSAEKMMGGKKLGIDAVRLAMLQATGLCTFNSTRPNEK